MTTEPILRWSVWGDDEQVRAMLSHSIGTFRRYFGSSVRYLVFADDPAAVRRWLRVPAEVREAAVARPRFDSVECTWRKWWPACRVDPAATELYVDADVFLLDEPVEIRDFLFGRDRRSFLCTEESFDRAFYGNFARSVDPALPYLNAGLVGQRAGHDLTAALGEAYDWWRREVPADAVDYHDEQGAVARALESHLRAGDVALLPRERHRVICPLNEATDGASIEGLVLLHATYPHRPAFWKYYDVISTISGVP
jgi:hypothetical protein